jgi:hypothetical protein
MRPSSFPLRKLQGLVRALIDSPSENKTKVSLLMFKLWDALFGTG